MDIVLIFSITKLKRVIKKKKNKTLKFLGALIQLCKNDYP